MITNYIDINGYWGVLFIYDFDRSDKEELKGVMDSFGMSRSEIKRAMKILLGRNTGMTISRDDIRMSAMFIGKATSMEQFADTISHEIDHCQDAICDYYGVALGSEQAAWTQGYLARQIARELKYDVLETQIKPYTRLNRF